MPDDLEVCSAPGCDFTTRNHRELAEQVNDEHPGEYNRPDWPDLGDV